MFDCFRCQVVYDNSQKISKLDGIDFDDLEGLKKKKTKIRGDRG